MFRDGQLQVMAFYPKSILQVGKAFFVSNIVIMWPVYIFSLVIHEIMLRVKVQDIWLGTN